MRLAPVSSTRDCEIRMTPERYQQLMKVVDQVIDLPPEDRHAILNQFCKGDRALRREAEQLLAAKVNITEFLEHSPLEALNDVTADSMVDRRIGRYRITEAIGRGGMGAVYKGVRDDDEYQTEVAIKLIKRGMDTDYILRRFRNERQILANLNHPNIARLLDGGTTEDGLPYFVMEYIDGQAIDDYCSEKSFTTEECLQLFRVVGSAVQYAHQNFIVHRDLKPANILITKDGVPKLLDFGIAKILQTEATASATALTATELRVMTPHYASPEQIKGAQITTASDVYSLGVVLYELLTGQKPYRFDSKAADDIARVICEQEPLRPSRAVRDQSACEPGGSTAGDASDSKASRRKFALRGDMDAIVMMALRKEPERRYSSVEQFSDDIGRYLDGLPVRAHRDTVGYRASKFVRRHKTAVAATAVVVLAIVAGVIAALWQGRIARVERAKAERRFNDVRRLAHSVIFDYHDQIATLAGSTPLRRQIIQDSLQYLDRLAQESGNDLALLREMGSAYEKIGKVQGNSYYTNLGDTDGAMISYQKSLDIRLRLAAMQPDNPDIQWDLANSYGGVADMYYTVGDLRVALENYERAAAILDRLVAGNPANVDYAGDLSIVNLKLGDIKGNDAYANLGDTAGAAASYNKAVEIRERMLAADPASEETKAELSVALSSSGLLSGAIGDLPRALQDGRKAITLLEELLAAHPDNARYRSWLLTDYMRLRYALEENNELPEAIQNTRRTLAMLEALAKADPQNRQSQRNLAVCHNALGDELELSGRLADAITEYEKALKINEVLFAVESKDVEHKQDLAFTFERLATAQYQRHDYQGALASFRKALSFADMSPQAPRQNTVSAIYAGTGNTLAALGNFDAAGEALNHGVMIAEQISAKSPTNARLKRNLALRYSQMAALHLQTAQSKRNTDAQTEIRQLIDYYRKSFSIYEELSAKGLLPPIDRGKRDEIAGQIARYRGV